MVSEPMTPDRPGPRRRAIALIAFPVVGTEPSYSATELRASWRPEGRSAQRAVDDRLPPRLRPRHVDLVRRSATPSAISATTTKSGRGPRKPGRGGRDNAPR